MKGISRFVDLVIECFVNSKIVALLLLVRQPLSLEDELYDPRAHGLSEEVVSVHIKPENGGKC